MCPEFTRREFFQTAGVVASGLVLSGCGVGQSEEKLVPFIETPEQQVAGNFTFYASICRECPAGCGILARTMGGRCNKLEGNPQHPVSQGRLCARGQAGLQALYNPDRLETAESRTGGRDSDFDPIIWDDGVARLAEGLAQADGRIAVFAGQLPDHVYRIVARMLEAAGANPPVVWSLFRAAEGRNVLLDAAEEVFGERRLPLFDIGASDAVVSFNAGFLETWLSPVLYSRGYAELRTGQTRGTLVQVEPRLSMTAANADVWLPAQGGREGEVALAMGRIILDEGLAAGDRPTDLDALFEDVRPRDLAQELDLDFEELVTATRTFANARAPLALPGGGLTAFRNAPAAVRAVLALDVLVGAPNSTVWLTPPPPGDGLGPTEQVSSFDDVRRLVEDMQGGDIDVLLVLDGDPLHDLPRALGFEEASSSVELIVDFSSFPTDTSTFLADLRLPSPTYLETWGYDVPQPGTALSTLSAQQPVVRPMLDTRSPVDVLLSAAQRAGGGAGEALVWENEMAYLRETVTGLGLGGSGSITVEEPESFFLAWRQFGGWWDTDEQLPEIAAAPPANARPEAPEVPADEGRRFRLHVYPHLLLAEGRHANKPWMQEIPDPMTTVVWQSWVEVAPEVAAELAVETGDIVRVASSAGEIEVPVYVYPGLGDDVVAMPLGQGHRAYGRYAADRGANTADLVELIAVDGVGELAWGSTRVSLEKTGRSTRLARLEQSDSTHLPTGL